MPRLASVGTPGEASAVEHVDARVGSSAEPMPAADPANEPVAMARRFARTRESDVETSEWLASAFAVGPEVVGAGAEPSGAEGSRLVADALVGTVAWVPGPDADIDPPDDELGAAVLELVAPIGSLELTLAGPTAPGDAEALPPAMDESVPGCRSGCADTVGPSALARHAVRLSRAATAMI